MEEPEEIIVRAKPPNRYRTEIELARDEMIRLFNEANEDDDNDVRCRYVPIGDNVFLESVRVRNLTCTCEGPAQ